MVADHAIFLRAEPLDGALRCEVEIVGSQPNDCTAEFLERMLEEQELAGGVDVRALPRLGVPGIPDLDAVYGRYDVVIARRTDDLAGRQFPHDPRPHVPGLLPVEGSSYVRVDLIRFRNGREPEFPEPPVGGRRAQRLCVSRLEGFEPDPMSLEHH